VKWINNLFVQKPCVLSIRVGCRTRITLNMAPTNECDSYIFRLRTHYCKSWLSGQGVGEFVGCSSVSIAWPMPHPIVTKLGQHVWGEGGEGWSRCITVCFSRSVICISLRWWAIIIILNMNLQSSLIGNSKFEEGNLRYSEREWDDS
jgi:hypothetical protein